MKQKTFDPNAEKRKRLLSEFLVSTNPGNIQMISTSEIKISVVIAESQTDLAVQALHAAFELDALS